VIDIKSRTFDVRNLDFDNAEISVVNNNINIVCKDGYILEIQTKDVKVFSKLIAKLIESTTKPKTKAKV
jgi:hypothetical protein